MRTIGRLTFNKVKNAKPRPGGKAALLCDGGGLWLQVSSGRDGQINKAWFFRYAPSTRNTKPGPPRRSLRPIGGRSARLPRPISENLKTDGKTGNTGCNGAVPC